jgi:hypothetical protein
MLWWLVNFAIYTLRQKFKSHPVFFSLFLRMKEVELGLHFLLIFHYGIDHGLQFESYLKLIMKSNCYLIHNDILTKKQSEFNFFHSLTFNNIDVPHDIRVLQGKTLTNNTDTYFCVMLSRLCNQVVGYYKWKKGDNTNILKLQKKCLFDNCFLSNLRKRTKHNFLQSFWMYVWRSLITHDYSRRLTHFRCLPCPLIWTQSSTYGTLLNQRNVQCQNMVELTNAIPTREASSPS